MSIIQQAAGQRKELEAAVAQALHIASGASDSAEVTISKSTGISVTTRLQEVEKIEFNSDGALSITVYHQQRKGHALSTDLGEQAIRRTVQAALDIARYTSPDPCAGPAEAGLLAIDVPDPDLFYPLETDVEAAITTAIEAEQYAMQADPRIVNSEGGSFNSHYSIKVFGSSYGMLQSYCSSRHSLSCSVIARQDEDMQRDYAFTIARDVKDLSTARWVGEECARRTVARLQPRKLTTRQAPVLFVAEVAPGLFGHLASAISGGSLYRKSSFLLNHLGKQVLPAWLTIEERPHIAKGLASAPFDAEGVKTAQREIVREGILQSYLLSSYTGRKLGMQSTGHAGGIHNWMIAGQGKNLSQLLHEMGTGLLVTELLGQGVSIVTGDYSRGAAGFWVENGEIQYPVSEITIAGNLRQMLLDIAAVGDDIEKRGSIQCGSVLIPAMQIAGV